MISDVILHAIKYPSENDQPQWGACVLPGITRADLYIQHGEEVRTVGLPTKMEVIMLFCTYMFEATMVLAKLPCCWGSSSSRLR
jgi:hypothetical protein